MLDKLRMGLSLTGNGYRDWLVQRVTAIILAAYFLFIITFFIVHPNMQFATWQNLNANYWMRVINFIVFLSLLLHAWVGVWTIITDYAREAIPRLLAQIVLVIILFMYLFYGLKIL